MSENNAKNKRDRELSSIADDIKELMRNECAKPANMLDPSFFRFHVEVIENYSSKICHFLGADPGLVRIAAYIHDIAAVRDFSTLKEHHLRGAEMARDFLKGKISDQDIDVITDSIAHHSFPVRDGLPETIVISHADAMSQIDSPVFWISYGFKRKFLTLDESISWYGNMIAAAWDAMIPEARVFAEESYSNTKRILAALQ